MNLFCLVHGSSQNAEGWGLLIPELEKRGHRAITLDLPTNEPESSATRYADLIVNSIDSSGYDCRDIIVVAHSASGMFLPLVAARRPIHRMVFLAALVPQIGTSIIEQFKADPGMLNPDWVGKNPMDESVAREFLFHDCPSELIDWALKTRRIMNAQRALTEICPIDTWPDLPATYIVCKEDRTISPSWSRKIARERLGVEPIEMAGGHCPYVSRPSELAEVLASIEAF